MSFGGFVAGATGFQNGYQSAEARQQAVAARRAQLEQAAQLAQAKLALEQAGIKQRADAAAGTLAETARHNKSGEQIAQLGNLDSLAGKYGNTPTSAPFIQARRGMFGYSKNDYPTAGEIDQEGLYNRVETKPDGTQVVMPDIPPTLYPSLVDPVRQANVDNTLAQTAKTETETGLLKPRFDLDTNEFGLKQKTAAETIRHNIAAEALQKIGINTTAATARRGQDSNAATARAGQANSANIATAGRNAASANQQASFAHQETMTTQKQAHDDAKAIALKTDADLEKDITESKTRLSQFTKNRDSAYADAATKYGQNADVQKIGNQGHTYWQGQIDTEQAKLRSLQAHKQDRHPTNGQFVPTAKPTGKTGAIWKSTKGNAYTYREH